MYKHFQLKCNCNLLLFLLLLLLGTGTTVSFLGSVWENKDFFPTDKQIGYIPSSPFNFWTLSHKDNNLSEDNGMDASCWNNSCNSSFTIDITQEFIKNITRRSLLIHSIYTLHCGRCELILPCSSIYVNRNTHAYIYTQNICELILEGENYPWHSTDWCKYSSYFHSACSLTVGLKRVLNKPLFHILVAACLKVFWRRFRGWYKSYPQRT